MKNLSGLVGSIIHAAWIKDDVLTFDTSKGHAGFSVEGDCCSHSYFHEITGVDKIIGREIVSVEEISNADEEFPVSDEEAAHHECLSVYGFRVSAAPEMQDVAGVPMEVSRSMIIVFRNSSNGYYGGWLFGTAPGLRGEGETIENNWRATSS